MSAQPKPSIVFVHGLWADGSCFSKLIPLAAGGGTRSHGVHQASTPTKATSVGAGLPEGNRI